MEVRQRDHIVQTQVFEINFPEREKVTELQNRVSQLFNSRLRSLMGEAFDKYIPPQLLLKLDALELDLGHLPYAHFEEVLAERFAMELEKALGERMLYIDNPAAVPGMQVSTLKTSSIDLLEYFLVNGSMPWWAGNVAEDSLQALFDTLVLENPGAVRQLMLRTGKMQQVPRRLIYRFGEATLRAVINLLQPGEAEFIFEYHRHIVALHHRQPLIKSDTTGFEREIMVFVASAVLVDRGSQFNKKMFVKSALQQLAAHYNVNYEEVLFLLSRPSQAIVEERGKTELVPLLIFELFSEQVQQSRVEPSLLVSAGERALDLREQAELLRHYLLFGALPAGAAYYEPGGLRRVFSDLLIAAPGLAGELLKLAAAAEKATEHFFQIVNETLFEQVVILAEAKEKEFILGYTHLLSRFHAKITGQPYEQEHGRLAEKTIFTFLFSNPANVFNKKALLENTVRQAARLYNRPFATVLSFLAQFVGEHRAKETYDQFFYLVTGALKEAAASVGENEKPPPAEIQPVAEEQLLLLPVALRNSLYHFLAQGYLSWWVSSYAFGSPVEMLTELIRAAPEQARLLLKLAGTHTQARQRLLRGFQNQIVLSLFKTLNDGDAAMETVSASLQFAEGNGGIANREAARLELLEILWDTYETSGYRQFNARLYAEKMLACFALKMGVSMAVIAKQLSADYAFSGELRTWFNSYAENTGANPVAARPDSDELLPWTEWLKDQLLPPALTDKTQLLKTAQEILGYFLTWNVLPGTLAALQTGALQIFLKQLLLFIGGSDAASLKNLMAAPHASSEAKGMLHRVMEPEISLEDKAIKQILSEFATRDLLQQIKERSLMLHTGAETLEALLHTALEQSNANKREILHLLLTSGELKQKVAWQFSANKFYELLAVINPGISAKTIHLLEDLRQFLELSVSDTLEREKLGALLKEYSLYYFADSGKMADFEKFMQAFFIFLAARKEADASGIFPLLIRNSASLPLTSLLHQSGHSTALQQQLRQLANRRQETKTILSDLKESDDALLKKARGLDMGEQRRAEQRFLQQDQQRLPVEAEDYKRFAEPAGEKIYIQNAGLVLLHPFISTLFKRAGLTDNNQFVNIEAKHRAAYLLQYLVYGNGAYAEHSMTLNKLLCGFALQEPLLPAITLAADEMEMAQGLLQSVTQQWEKMRSTSVPGFQASFLQRNAILMQLEENWSLKVEQRGYDVLLQTLPWSFGMIKTPWMDKFLYVEWT